MLFVGGVAQRNFPESAAVAGKICAVLKYSFLGCAASVNFGYKAFQWLLWDWTFVFLIRIEKKVL